MSKTEDDDADWSDLLTPETKKSIDPTHLEATKLKTFRSGVDEVTEFPCVIVPASIEDMEAISDLDARAEAINLNGVRPKGDRERALIQSVAESFPFGWATQAEACASVPVGNEEKRQLDNAERRRVRSYKVQGMQEFKYPHHGKTEKLVKQLGMTVPELCDKIMQEEDLAERAQLCLQYYIVGVDAPRVALLLSCVGHGEAGEMLRPLINPEPINKKHRQQP